MRLRYKKNYIAFAVLAYVFLFVGSAQAAFLKPETKEIIEGQADISSVIGGYDIEGDIYGLIQTVINAFLSLIGVILLAYLLYAGYKWMTAHGEEEKVTQAKDTIQRAIIGIIIIVAAYAISIFVMGRLEAGTLESSSSGTSAPAPAAPGDGGGSNADPDRFNRDDAI